MLDLKTYLQEKKSDMDHVEKAVARQSIEMMTNIVERAAEQRLQRSQAIAGSRPACQARSPHRFRPPRTRRPCETGPGGHVSKWPRGTPGSASSAAERPSIRTVAPTRNPPTPPQHRRHPAQRRQRQSQQQPSTGKSSQISVHPANHPTHPLPHPKPKPGQIVASSNTTDHEKTRNHLTTARKTAAAICTRRSGTRSGVIDDESQNSNAMTEFQGRIIRSWGTRAS
jgi:hypothetical protein